MARMTETSALRELDAEIAEKVMRINPAWIHDERGGKMIDVGRMGVVRVAPVERYSATYDGAAQVEEEIARRGLGAEYADELRLAVLGHLDAMDSDAAFKLLRASPELKARAALQAIAHDSQPANGVDQ